MTFRAKPVARRRGRAGWSDSERRQALINGGFIAAIVVSILILVGYAGWSWYDDHYGTVATVNGRTINKDQLRTRARIEEFRLDYIQRQVQTLMANGRLSQAAASQQLSLIDQQKSQLSSIAVERLVDVSLQGELAAQRGITVSDAEIDQQIVDDATTKEQRHAWVIEVEPQPNATTGQIGDAEKAAAKAKADQALAQLKAGKSWDDVAKTASTAQNAPQAGDLGWVQQNSSLDQPWLDALFAAKVNEPTAVILGDDGTYRIGRATEVAPATTDQTFTEQIKDAGISMDDYRLADKADVIRKKLGDSVVADMSKPGPQRHVLQLHLPERNESSAATPEDGVKVRRILFAPKDDPANASKLDANDPAWKAAFVDAENAYLALLKDPSKFDAMARAQTDEIDAKANGGKQPWAYPSDDLDKPYKDAIFDTSLTEGEILAPVKTSEGWYVIQFMRRSTQGDDVFAGRLKARADAGEDFSQLVRDNGEGDEVASGGDIGWVAKGQLDQQLDAAIFSTTVGQVSDPVVVSGDGVYLFKIVAEETRDPTAKQLAAFKANGFDYWYNQEKAKATITYAGGSSDTSA